MKLCGFRSLKNHTTVTVYSPFNNTIHRYANIKHRLRLTNHIRVFFRFAYYLGVSPFKILQHIETSGKIHYSKETWKPQQAVCLIIHICYVFYLFGVLRKPFTNSSVTASSSSPREYIYHALRLFSLVYKFILMKRLWFNGSHFVTVLNSVSQEYDLSIGSSWFTRKPFLYCLHASSVIRIFVLIFGKDLTAPGFIWAPKEFWKRMRKEGRYTYGFGWINTASNDNGIVNEILACLMSISWFARYIVGLYSDLYILAAVMTLWTVSKCFASTLDKTSGSGLTCISKHSKVGINIYSAFQAVQRSSECINKAFGSMVLWYLGTILMFYSINTGTFVTSKVILERLDNTYLFGLTCCILYLSSDIRSQIESIQVWMLNLENAKTLQVEQCMAIYNEMRAHRIGVRANNFFTITFPFVGSCLGLAVTFFVINIQYDG